MWVDKPKIELYKICGYCKKHFNSSCPKDYGIVSPKFMDTPEQWGCNEFDEAWTRSLEDTDAG